MDLKELLGEELYGKVIEALKGKGKDGKDISLLINDGSYIPKDKFDAVNTEKNDLKKQIDERDKQLEELGKEARGNEELTKQIDELMENNKKAVEEYEVKLKQQAFDHALENAIANAKGKNIKAIKALLKTDDIKLDGDNLQGFEEQIKVLRESDGYLFDDSASSSHGANPPGSHNHQTEPNSLGEAVAQHYNNK